ncbi:unnamed protein product [Allacma fusca]|uniref:Uncharacterized protein n=1 Tax=Allacma fusca TaxID=39272 RepID=A0A8J2K320_9HEXA|nr:unnamed protein product [Allacma fusca]
MWRRKKSRKLVNVGDGEESKEQQLQPIFAIPRWCEPSSKTVLIDRRRNLLHGVNVVTRPHISNPGLLVETLRRKLWCAWANHRPKI